MHQKKHRSWAEPFRIKVVESLKRTTREYRERAIREAGYNTYLLRSEEVTFDLLTDSGTGAMSDVQWAGLMTGDESGAGSSSFFRLEESVRKYYGYRYIIPTHQGRGAEQLLIRSWLKPGSVLIGNFCSAFTRRQLELSNAVFEEAISDEARDPEALRPFKGNIDLAKLEALVKQYGAEKIGAVYVSLTGIAGHPVSMENLRAVREFCLAQQLRVVLDASRILENAYFVQRGEAGYSNHSIAHIVRELCSYSDACVVSAKKDLLVQTGGWLALNSAEAYAAARELGLLLEGMRGFGGLAGRDLDAMAIGIEEAFDDEGIRARVGQVEYLANHLLEEGIPIVLPAGGHAIYVDAGRFLPQFQKTDFAAVALSAAIFVESGIRGAPQGSLVSASTTSQEWVRLALPRRTYTQAHCDVWVESIHDVYHHRDEIRPLRLSYEPARLRFFDARFETAE